MLPLVMVRDDLLMTGDTSFAAKHFDALIDNALGVAGTPVSLFTSALRLRAHP